MREELKKPIELMRRDELVDLAQDLMRQRDHHKESVRCMSIVFDDLSKIAGGIKQGDVDALLERVAAHKQLITDLAALKTHSDYWAAPQFVHQLIDRACEVANGN